MSDEIPFHIQEEIMKRLPVKSLVQLRSVSKAWKSLIDSPQFIAVHSLYNRTQPDSPQNLHVSYIDMEVGLNHVSYIDDDTFPKQRSVQTLPLPLSTKQIIEPKVIGSSRGLVCLYGMDPSSKTHKILLWNPSIRKSTIVDLPAKPNGVGFGVCPVTNDPKIVSVTLSCWYEPDIETKVVVYTLSSGKWRSLLDKVPTELTQDSHEWSTTSNWLPVVTDRYIYWIAGWSPNTIMSFDVTNDIFEVIDLPDSVTSHPYERLSISKLRESLAILKYKYHYSDCTVWMMEDGVERSFTKIYTIMKSHDDIVGFRKSGEPIMEVFYDDDYDDDNDRTSKLILYESDSADDNILEFSPPLDPFYVNSYVETLLLLGRSDCISY